MFFIDWSRPGFHPQLFQQRNPELEPGQKPKSASSWIPFDDDHPLISYTTRLVLLVHGSPPYTLLELRDQLGGGREGELIPVRE